MQNFTFWYILLKTVEETADIRRCRLAGRGRTIGNRVTVNSGSRVRISPSPPKQKCTKSAKKSLIWCIFHSLLQYNNMKFSVICYRICYLKARPVAILQSGGLFDPVHLTVTIQNLYLLCFLRLTNIPAAAINATAQIAPTSAAAEELQPLQPFFPVSGMTGSTGGSAGSSASLPT